MKIKVNTPITSLKGDIVDEEVVTARDKSGNPLTTERRPVRVSKCIIDALMTTYKDDHECSGEVKIQRFEISEKIQNAESSVDLTIDELALVKKYIDKVGFNPLVYKRVIDVIENKEASLPEKSDEGEIQENGE